jgi:phage terminase large subunit
VNLRDPDTYVQDQLTRWRWDPVAFVREVLGAEPDPWQAEVLRAFPHVNRIAMKASKGPGKTTVESWCAWNFLLTRPNPKIGATSISEDNLDDNLWPEMAKWQQQSELLMQQFAWSKTRIVYREAPATWFMAARTWPKTADPQRQADTLAGLHADYILFILDESGGIPQAVMTTAEAVLASGLEAKVLQGGNPTMLEGPLYRACTTDRHLWFVVEINGDPDNPKRARRVNLQWAQQQIQSYGRENPWVMVNVLGQFPPASLNALLGYEEVNAAMHRHLDASHYETAQKRLGIDVARFGDDRTVIFPRQGLAGFRPRVLRHERNTAASVEIATAVITAKTKWGSELEFIDATGGWAAGAADILLDAGYPTHNVQFASTHTVDRRYKNRRAECWFQMAKKIKAGMSLPFLEEMIAELTTPTYIFRAGQFVLEEKDQIKLRLGRSPDLADALATTFALPEMPAQALAAYRQGTTALHDGDPFRLPRDRDDGGIWD